jgi:hypothetical protein
MIEKELSSSNYWIKACFRRVSSVVILPACQWGNFSSRPFITLIIYLLFFAVVIDSLYPTDTKCQVEDATVVNFSLVRFT